MKSITVEMYGIIAYFLICAVIAYMTRRTRSFSEFSIGNHKVPAAMIFASVAATYIGPGFSVGFATKGYSSGYAFWILSLTYAIQTVLVGMLFAPRLARFRNCHTIGDIMEQRYGKFTHFLAGVVSVGLCIGFTAIIGKIAGQLLHSITGWPLLVSVSVVTMFVAVYTFTGGVRAVIAADGVQFLWFSLMIPILLLLAFFKSPASASEVADKAMELTKSGFSGLTTIQIVGIMVSFLLGETLTPPYANRALAAQSETASRQGFVWAGLYCPIWLGICATIGIFGYQFLAPGTAADDVFLGMGKTLLPGVLYGALLAAVLAIVMSSQESLMNSASVALVRDVINLNGKLSDKKQLFFGRAGTMVIAVIAIVVSMYAPSIIDGLLICYSVWAPGLLVPLIFGLYLKRTRPMAGWLSMILGASASIVWQTVLKEPAGIPAILVGLTASLAAYAVGHLLDKKELPLITGENQ